MENEKMIETTNQEWFSNTYIYIYIYVSDFSDTGDFLGGLSKGSKHVLQENCAYMDVFSR